MPERKHNDVVLGRLLAGISQACGQSFLVGDTIIAYQNGYNPPLYKTSGYACRDKAMASFRVTREIYDVADECRKAWAADSGAGEAPVKVRGADRCLSSRAR